jgi:arylsulfatase A-like enzyme
MIAWWSNRKMDGLVNDRTVLSTIDFLPTLASLCQAPLPELYQSDGENLSRALSGELMVRSRPLYWEYGRNDESFAYPKDAFHRSPNVAVREGIWKLMVNANGTDVQLYNMSTDRNETQDVSTLYPEITRRLKEMALAWRMNLP